MVGKIIANFKSTSEVFFFLKKKAQHFFMMIKGKHQPQCKSKAHNEVRFHCLQITDIIVHLTRFAFLCPAWKV